VRSRFYGGIQYLQSGPDGKVEAKKNGDLVMDKSTAAKKDVAK
jgi:hypothetical protein